MDPWLDVWPHQHQHQHSAGAAYAQQQPQPHNYTAPHQLRFIPAPSTASSSPSMTATTATTSSSAWPGWDALVVSHTEHRPPTIGDYSGLLGSGSRKRTRESTFTSSTSSEWAGERWGELYTTCQPPSTSTSTSTSSSSASVNPPQASRTGLAGGVVGEIVTPGAVQWGAMVTGNLPQDAAPATAEEMDELLEEIINNLDEVSSEDHRHLMLSNNQQHASASFSSSATTQSSSLATPHSHHRHQLQPLPLHHQHQHHRQLPLANWAESGLYVWTNAARWLGAFERDGWTFTPLHPSVLSEDGLRSVLGGGSGSLYHSPPSSSSSSSASSSPSSSSFSLGSACLTGPAVFELNINTALAYGALITGNDARAEEFFERARKALEDLLEVNDYAVAEALFALGYYLYGRGDLVRFSYYITLAKQICQRIGACNSGVFLKCMMATVLDPSYTPAEKERTLRRYNRAVKDTPRWDDHHDRFLLDYNRPSHQGDDQYVAEEVTAAPAAGAITLGTIGGSSGEVTPHDVLDTVERTRNIDKCVTNVLMLVELHRWLRQEAEAGRGLDYDAMDTVLQQWRRLLVAMEEEIDSGEALPPTFKLTVTLTWLCFSAEYHQRTGSTEEALRFALAYLAQIQGGGIELCTSGCMALCEIMMDLCFELGRDDIVEALLLQARPLIERHPLCRDRAAAYRERLKARAV